MLQQVICVVIIGFTGLSNITGVSVDCRRFDEQKKKKNTMCVFL
jgi:hypothetical protein